MKIGRGETNHLYCDVDGTLLIWPTNPGGPTATEQANALAASRGERFRQDIMPKINRTLVERINYWRGESAGTLVIWSMGGPAHAEMARALCGFNWPGVSCIAKPDLAIDDNPLVWSKRKLDVVAPDGFKP